MRQRLISSRSNPLIKHLRVLKNPHARSNLDTFLVEGPKFVHDALTAGNEIVRLVVSEGYKGALPDSEPLPEIIRIPEKLFGEISDTATPQGLIAEVKLCWKRVRDLVGAGKHLIVGWGLQDPGNIGAMARSAAAFGLGGLIVSAGSADPFGPKAVRASAGAVLHVPLAKAAGLGKLVGSLTAGGYTVCWTGRDGATSLRDIPRRGPLAVFIGSEGKGFSDRDKNTIGLGLRVPISTRVESLNAAVVASIVAYELARGETGQT